MTCTLEISQYSHNILSYNYLEEIQKKEKCTYYVLGHTKAGIIA